MKALRISAVASAVAIFGLAICLWAPEELRMQKKVTELTARRSREVIVSSSGEKLAEISRMDRDGDGKIDLVHRQIFSEGIRVYSEVRVGTNGPSRVYGKQGDLFMMEVDEDCDGVFETLVIYGKQKQIIGVLQREKDGDIQPASDAKVQEVLRSKDQFDRTVKPIMDSLLMQVRPGPNEKDSAGKQRR